MKFLQLPDALHEYLAHVVERYALAGHHPDEALAIAKLWEAIKSAQHIEDEVFKKMAEAGAPPAPPEKQSYECVDCYEETGSLSCIRPAHKTTPNVL